MNSNSQAATTLTTTEVEVAQGGRAEIDLTIDANSAGMRIPIIGAP